MGGLQASGQLHGFWQRACMLSMTALQEEQKAELKAQTDQMAAAFQERAARMGEHSSCTGVMTCSAGWP